MPASSNKMTDNSDELSFNDLFVQSMQLQIPVFQREYRWVEKQLKRMLDEIDAIIEGKDETRFLGAIIAVKRSSNPSKPQVYEIVDGQQRLTTLYLLVLATAYTLAANNHNDEAKGIINKYLYNDWYEAGSNTKLLPSFKDRNQFKNVFGSLIQAGNLKERLQFRIKFTESSGSEVGKIASQFDRVRKVLAKEYRENGFERLNDIVNIAISKLTFIFILLKDASNATTVFHGLNDPGEPIGIGDLVRNEVFSYVYDTPSLASSIYNDTWEPFHRRLGDFYDKYFFPYAIIHEPSIKNSNLFRGLRDIWGTERSPAQIINELNKYTNAYLSIVSNNVAPEYDDQIKIWLKKLRSSNSPSSIHPFVMRLLKEYEDQKIEAKIVVDCLQVIESFLIRRAICGIEPTGLLSVFRVMWSNLKGEVTANKIKTLILNRSTIDWPDDERLKASIISKKLYGASICSYVLMEYDKSLNSDFPEGQNPWIEHILPQTLNDSWKKIFTEKEHEMYVNTWGNLVPLSSKMNREISQALFSTKKPILQTDSMYSSARKLANDYSEWTKASIVERSNQIANWAIIRWKK